MNVFVITRETPFAYNTKVVFDKRDLVNNEEALKSTAKEIWPEDPDYTPDNRITYCADLLPVKDITLRIELYQQENVGGVWFWETAWTAYDYNDNILKSIYECGYGGDYMSVAQEAQESYLKALR